MKKVVGIAVSTLVVLVVAGLGYFALRKPAMAPPSGVRVESTPELIARGKYIYEVAADCAGCHSERDYSKFSGPFVAGGRGKGFTFPPELGLPGKVTASNITPDLETGIGAWTDGEKIRAIREGVGRDGHAEFPMMPYQNYRRMSDEDVQALVAYLDSMPPVKNKLPKTELDFPLRYLIVGFPQPVAGPVVGPDKNDPVKYGEYLVTIAACVGCHTQEERGQPNPELLFAGGHEFRIGKFSAKSTNLTPDVETGIGSWTEERFLQSFRKYGKFAQGAPLPPATDANFTPMPWPVFSQRPDDELKAIFAYLRTLKPLRKPGSKPL